MRIKDETFLEMCEKTGKAVNDRDARIAELEMSVALGDRQVENMAKVLRDAQAKLEKYRQAHGGEYVGGVEYATLMAMIEAVLPPLTQPPS